MTLKKRTIPTIKHINKIQQPWAKKGQTKKGNNKKTNKMAIKYKQMDNQLDKKNKTHTKIIQNRENKNGN